MIKMKANNFSNNINLMGDFNMIYMKLLILNVSIFMLCTLNAASNGQVGQGVRAQVSRPTYSGQSVSQQQQNQVQRRNANSVQAISPLDEEFVIGWPTEGGWETVTARKVLQNPRKFSNLHYRQVAIVTAHGPRLVNLNEIVAQKQKEEEQQTVTTNDYNSIQKSLVDSRSVLSSISNRISNQAQKEGLGQFIAKLDELYKDVDRFFGKRN